MIGNFIDVKILDIIVNKILKKINNINIDSISLSEILSMFNSKNLVDCITSLYLIVYRYKGIKLFKSQLRAIVGLIKDNVLEMKTGEGKTLVIMCYVLIKARDEKVHIATTNDYLSKRDYENSKEIFNFLRITSIFNDRDNRKGPVEVYENDVVYSSCESLIFDYLEYEYNKEFKYNFDNIIIDEIDYVLVDNATSTFSISTETIGLYDYNNMLKIKFFAESLVGKEVSKDDIINLEKTLWDFKTESMSYDYYYEEKSKFLYITDTTYDILCKLFMNGEQEQFNILETYLTFNYYMQAILFFKRDVDYKIKDESIYLINSNNGRLQPNSQFEIDLHAAIHIKENMLSDLQISLENSMTYQIFFNMYKNVVGISGTVKAIEQEINLIYEKNLIVIPENKKSQRFDFTDIMFRNKNEANEYILKTIKNNYNKNPILIVCQSDLNAEKLYNFVYFNDVRAVIFNNSTPYKIEDEIIDKVGIPGNITISTQLMGRGTDIILKSKNKEKGLIVLCLGHFTSKRIDLQVRGRAGRQGENGYTQFINTLEDDVFKILGVKDNIKIKETYESKIQLEEKGRKYQKYIKKAQNLCEYSSFNTRIVNYTYDYIIETNKPKFKYDLINYTDNWVALGDENLKTMCLEIMKLNWFIYKKYMLHIKHNMMTTYNSYGTMQKYIEFHRMSVEQLKDSTIKAKESMDKLIEGDK